MAENIGLTLLFVTYWLIYDKKKQVTSYDAVQSLNLGAMIHS